MNPFRRLLRFFLGLLAKRAIRKHNLELIVVAGWYGTPLAREMLYTVLSEKLNVRRNTREIWWDFSIPLAVLGYQDKRRSIPQWLLLIFRATIYLLLGKSNPHILILNADCTYEMTADYWAGIIKPDYLLILNYEKRDKIVRKLIEATDPDKGRILFNPETINKKVAESLERHRKFTFGEGKVDLKVSMLKKIINMSYNKQHVSIPKNYLHSFSLEMLGGVFSVSVLKGLELTEAGFNSLKFDISGNVVSTIRHNLEFNKLQ